MSKTVMEKEKLLAAEDSGRALQTPDALRRSRWLLRREVVRLLLLGVAVIAIWFVIDATGTSAGNKQQIEPYSRKALGDVPKAAATNTTDDSDDDDAAVDGTAVIIAASITSGLLCVLFSVLLLRSPACAPQRAWVGRKWDDYRRNRDQRRPHERLPVEAPGDDIPLMDNMPSSAARSVSESMGSDGGIRSGGGPMPMTWGVSMPLPVNAPPADGGGGGDGDGDGATRASGGGGGKDESW